MDALQVKAQLDFTAVDAFHEICFPAHCPEMVSRIGGGLQTQFFGEGHQVESVKKGFRFA